MKARTRKHQAQRLQLAAAKLGQWGADSRYYGGAKWTRRQQEALAGEPQEGFEFNRIMSDAESAMWLDCLKSAAPILPRPGNVTA